MKRTIVGLGIAALAYLVEVLATTGDEVEVFESSDKMGARILVSGNGRCNIFNRAMFHGSEKYFVSARSNLKHLVVESDFAKLKKLFERIGLDYFFDSEGRAYPFSNSAKSVELLFEKCLSLYADRITYHYQTSIQKIDPFKQEIVDSSGKTYRYEQIFLGTGGVSYDRDPKKYVDLVGIKSLPFRPALGPITPDLHWPKRLTGLRLRGKLSLYRKKEVVFSESGELLFKEKQLSGIMIFDASLYLEPPLEDYLLDIDLTYHDDQRCCHQHQPMSFLPPKFVDCLSELPYLDGHLRCRILDGPSFQTSQVSRGGIDLDEVDLSTMSLKRFSNFHLGGEAVDVTGICGGYNIGWALISGLRAASDR